MTTIQEPIEAKWFCETCGDTTPHKRVYDSKLHRKAFECLRCGEQFTRQYEEPKWRTNKHTHKYRYEMRCTHCGHEWNTKSLKMPRDCPNCRSRNVVVVGLTTHWRRQKKEEEKQR